MDSKREIIQGKFSDIMADVLYYDRKGDEELGVGEIEQAILDGEVTILELLGIVTDELSKAVYRSESRADK